MQELKIRPCPIVFASFSGGPKACMYKVLQVNAILADLKKVYKFCLCLFMYCIIETQDNEFLGQAI